MGDLSEVLLCVLQVDSLMIYSASGVSGLKWPIGGWGLTVNFIQAHYVILLSSFKEQLQQHVRVHAMEAVMACWELEQSLQSLTGVSPGEGT
ncbi:hypothetical protein HanHA300_Chr14g0512231 [Helianthus annuus]|nr:hypothetical protein HanHA300_Chr14g0512231 [Helianthus annuus]KAJ0484545.1 hypothetical protein HanHA89_Chr14g0545301 [Helianthus annuus]KAJ0655100.1 hypothetical protein HanLR1_Chr14g0514591 [Helianthus annuus]KAJ0658808.1 hypothetical protein HanOQP8_Chr14g0512371 [Helianthus annuus]